MIVDKAITILGKDKVDATKTSAEIRRACVDKVVGDTAKGWNDEQVIAGFAAIQVAGARKMADAFDPNKTNGPANLNDGEQKLEDSHNKYLERLTGAHRQKVA